MKYIIYLIIILFTSCTNSIDEQRISDIKNVKKNQGIELLNFTIHNKNRLLLKLKNSTLNDYYIKCYDVKNQEIPTIEAITKLHNFQKNRWEMPVATNVDTTILFRSNTEMQFFLITKTESIDSLHVETYFDPVLLDEVKREKLIMHFVIKQNTIRKYDDSTYIDRLMIDSIFAKYQH